MGRKLLALSVLLCIVLPAALSTPVMGGNFEFTYNSWEKEGRLYVEFRGGTYSVGNLVLRRLSTPGSLPSDIYVEYRFRRYTLERWGEEPRLLVLLDYRLLNVDTGSWVEDTLVLSGFEGAFTLASLAPGGDLTLISVERLVLTVVAVYRNGDTATVAVDLLQEAHRYGLDLSMVKNVHRYAFRVERTVMDPGWVGYKLVLGGRDIGLLKVTASQFFNRTAAVRFHYDLADETMSKLLTLEISMRVASPELPSSREVRFTMEPGSDVVIPGAMPSLKGLEEIYLENVVARFSIPNYQVVVNISSDVGTIHIVKRRAVFSEYLPGSVMEAKPLGGGWVGVLVGLAERFDASELQVAYEAKSGSPRPLLVKAVVMEGMEGYQTTIWVLMAFGEEGVAEGTLLVKTTNPTVSRRLEVPISVPIEGAATITVKPLEASYRVEEMNSTWLFELDRIQRLIRTGLVSGEELERYRMLEAILVSALDRYDEGIREYVVRVDVGDELGFGDTVVLQMNLSITADDPAEPILIYVEPVFRDTPPAMTSSIRYVYLANSTSWGSIYTYPEGGKAEVRLTLRIGYQLEGVGKWPEDAVNRLGEVWIHVVNAQAVELSGFRSSYVAVSPPERDPRVSSLVHVERPGLDILAATLYLGVPALILIAAIIAALRFRSVGKGEEGEEAEAPTLPAFNIGAEEFD